MDFKIGILAIVVGIAIVGVIVGEVSAAICEKPGSDGCTNTETQQCCAKVACWDWEPLYTTNICVDDTKHWVYWGHTNPLFGHCECHL